MAKLSKDQKSGVMASIGVNYAVIERAKKDVHALEVQAAPEIKAIVDSFGPGPHKMTVPTGEQNPDGSPKTRDMIANFRKNGDTFTISAVAADSID